MLRTWTILCLIVLLLLPPASASRAEDEISPLLLMQLASIESTVVELRNLPLIEPLQRAFPSREDVIARYNTLFEEEFTDEDVLKETQFYRAFDFIGADVDLVEVYLALLTDQIAGFYDTETRLLNVVRTGGGPLGDSLIALDRITYAHELTHALQDQHFGLDGYLDDIEEPDAALAALALIEGDAMLITQEYITVLVRESPLSLLAIMGSAVLADASIPEGTPPILEAELMMPYVQGLEFVSALYRRGGWEMVNAAYENPPTSTAQILNPSLYFDGITPLEVTITPLDDVLGDGWELLIDRTLGKFYLREYLQTQLTPAEVSQAVTGWRGDRYHLYHNAADDSRAWILQLVWDQSAQADAFEAVYASFAAARMQDQAASAPLQGMQCWEAMAEALCLLRLGSDTFIAYAPESTQAAALIEGQLELAGA